MEFQEFLTRQAARIGKKQVDIKNETGASKGTVNQWFNDGTKPGPKFYSKLSRSLLVDLSVLLAAIDGELPNSYFDSLPDDELISTASQFVFVPMVDSFYKAGLKEGFNHKNEPSFLTKLSFRRDWLEYMGLDCKHLACAMIAGDSMAEKINKLDVILIDTRPHTLADVENGAIYALELDGQPMVKYLFMQERGGVVLSSEVEQYKDIEIPESETSSLSIIGRAVWRGGSL